MSKMSLNSKSLISLRFGLSVTTKMVACTMCGNRVDRKVPIWTSTAPGGDTAFFCHICSPFISLAVDSAANVYNRWVDKLNGLFGLKLKKVSKTDICAKGHDVETYVMYGKTRTDEYPQDILRACSDYYERIEDVKIAKATVNE
jgi:hypothetical protein